MSCGFDTGHRWKCNIQVNSFETFRVVNGPGAYFPCLFKIC